MKDKEQGTQKACICRDSEDFEIGHSIFIENRAFHLGLHEIRVNLRDKNT